MVGCAPSGITDPDRFQIGHQELHGVPA